MDLEEDSGVFRLEGKEETGGGLVIKKKPAPQGNFEFKVPKTSLLGLDRLAALKRKEKLEAEAADVKANEEDNAETNDKKRKTTDEEVFKKPESREKNYRDKTQETPTHTGGVTREARERMAQHRSKERYRGVHVAREDKKKGSESYKDRDRGRRNSRQERERDRSYGRDRDRDRRRRDRGGSSRRSDWESPRFKDEPLTPALSVRDSPSRSGWEEDDVTPSPRSSWDYPTPRTHDERNSDWSERSRRPTPAHKFNSWAAERKSSGATPIPGKEDEVAWGSGSDRENWELEQRRLDREWYGLDEGADEGRDPFGPMSAEYVKKRERQLESRKNKRLSAQQRQINKDNELWERNRMLTSGVVQSVDLDDDFDEENEARVHLLVHNIVPPFLDGRIVFTKQPEPVIPVKDPTSDMALTSRKGSALVRTYREQKERRKAQKKHWEVSGTTIGNIMGVEKKDDKESEKGEGEPDADYKTGQKFAEHMKDSAPASSDFAKKKTIKEQREYLPVFAVRAELLNIIRENNVVIIVGETGSGKTTQLTQYLKEDGYC
ncbi:hypothetical protein GE061_014648, partial [Apolygus lucorum]